MNDEIELEWDEAKRQRTRSQFVISKVEGDSLRSQFVTSNDEGDSLRSQFATSKSNRGGRRYVPYAFTEQGVAMLSSVLNSPRGFPL